LTLDLQNRISSSV